MQAGSPSQADDALECDACLKVQVAYCLPRSFSPLPISPITTSSPPSLKLRLSNPRCHLKVASYPHQGAAALFAQGGTSSQPRAGSHLCSFMHPYGSIVGGSERPMSPPPASFAPPVAVQPAVVVPDVNSLRMVNPRVVHLRPARSASPQNQAQPEPSVFHLPTARFGATFPTGTHHPAPDHVPSSAVLHFPVRPR